jgi:heat shock protein HtpX
MNGAAISRGTMFRWFGARLLRPAKLPELLDILIGVCNRARLSRLPDIYCLPSPGEVNAYALGRGRRIHRTKDRGRTE